MRKTINVKPITELELKFNEGKAIILRFDIMALSNFNKLDGGLEEFMNDISIPEICAKIIFTGGTSYNEDLTIEEARKIVSNLDPETITVIINEFNESIGAGKNEVQKELQKKLMAKFRNTIK